VQIAKTKSRELMSLGTLTISLGFAFTAYTIFGASFALGAFLAGLVLNESEIGQKSAQHSLPLRDIFAVLFFISVGMLFNPAVLLDEPFMVFVTLLIIIIGKPLFTYFITRALHQSVGNSLIVAISLAQVGEFSFILAAMALKIGVISSVFYDCILFGALVSIALNPFLFKIKKIEQTIKSLKIVKN
jgi:CPA2 family monovalent cation:H+ antiporter-2